MIAQVGTGCLRRKVRAHLPSVAASWTWGILSEIETARIISARYIPRWWNGSRSRLWAHTLASVKGGTLPDVPALARPVAEAH